MDIIQIPTLVVVPPDSDAENTQDEEEGGEEKVGAQKEGKRDVYIEGSDRPMEDDKGGGSMENVPNGTGPAEERPTLTRRRGFPKKERTNAMLLQPLEMQFVQSIRRRDVSGVEASMKEDPGLHRLEDNYGVSALEHAVLSGSVAIVEKLIEKCQTAGEKQQAVERAMLFAIKENDLSMMDRLIDMHQEIGGCRNLSHKIREAAAKDTSPEVTAADIQLESRLYLKNSPSLDLFHEDAEFSQDIKPMVLAAQLDRAEIIEMLYSRCCPSIHPVTKKECLFPGDCLICHERLNFVGRQTIEECRQAVEVYKALSSPAYLFHTGVDDPLLEAFVISDLMEKRQVVDPAYCDEYEAISKRCQTFASTLLTLCRSVDEVQTLFGATNGIEWTHRTKYHEARFPRLLLAIHFNQKQFVAHPHCQQVMQNEWYRGLPDWVCRLKFHHLRLGLYTLLLFTFMPIIFFLYLFRLHFIERFVKPAANKFILDMCSFIYFLIMLFLKVSFGLKAERGGPPTVLDYFIFIWVIGLSVRYAKMSVRRRDRCRLLWSNAENSNWRIFELIMLLCFWIQYIILFVLAIDARVHPGPLLKRQELPGTDVFLWAEVFGACACTLTVVQVYSFFKVSSTLGPLQVSLKKMIFDVLKFMVLFLVVLSAFAMGLAYLYSGYKGLQAFNLETNETVTQPEAFTSLQEAYKRLFWDLFNYGNEENADLVVGNSGGLTEVSGPEGYTAISSHRLTEIVGYIMYGAYHITVIVVLLNMLIAMMANSYNNIEANADTEWKFARTRLFMNYLNEIGVLCPPFNLLPIRALLAKCAKTRCARQGKCTCCRVFERKESRQRVKDPTALMERLRKRYWKMRGAKRRALEQTAGPTGLLRDSPRTPSLKEPRLTMQLDGADRSSSFSV